MRPIVVVAPSFRDDIGGVIVLHYLVHSLRSLGIEAYLFPRFRPWFGGIAQGHGGGLAQSAKNAIRAIPKNIELRRNYRTHPTFDAPIADSSILKDSIVVYSETVNGNPLRADRVVRWYLHRPGYINASASYGEGELSFFYQEGFAPSGLRIDSEDILRIRWLRDDVYCERGGERRGACRLVRKGNIPLDEIRSMYPDDIIVDGMSHEEMADVFNRTEIMWCHDFYTMYCYYAALCGCTPVVVPSPGVSASEWRAGFEMKAGVAYGPGELEWARQTRQELIDGMAASKCEEREMVLSFFDRAQSRFL
jgi:hypothetical protein